MHYLSVIVPWLCRRRWGSRKSLLMQLNLITRGLAILEHILSMKNQQSPVLGHVQPQIMVMVGAWYIWWERRQHLQSERIQSPQ